MDEELYFEIFDGNFLRITPVAFKYPNTTDSYDNNWVDFKIEIKAGSFSANYNAEILTTDLTSLRDMLKYLYDHLSWEARFEDIERYFKIHLKGDGIGHFTANIIARDKSDYQSPALEFNLSFDQTMIPLMVNKLDEIALRFPLR